MKLLVIFLFLCVVLLEVKSEPEGNTDSKAHGVKKKALTQLFFGQKAHKHHHHHHHHHHHPHYHHHHHHHHHPHHNHHFQSSKRSSLPQLLANLGKGLMQLGTNLNQAPAQLAQKKTLPHTVPKLTEPKPFAPYTPTINATEQLPKMPEAELPVNRTLIDPVVGRFDKVPPPKVAFQDPIPAADQPAPTGSVQKDPLLEATTVPPSSSPPQAAAFAPAAELSAPQTKTVSAYENNTSAAAPNPDEKTPEEMVMRSGEEPGKVTTALQPARATRVEPVASEFQPNDARADPVDSEPKPYNASVEPIKNDERAESVAEDARVNSVTNDARVNPVADDARVNPVTNDARVGSVAHDARVEPVANETSVEPSEPSPVDDQTGETQRVPDLPNVSNASINQSPTPKRATPVSSTPKFLGVPSAGFKVHYMDDARNPTVRTPSSASMRRPAGPSPSSQDQEDLDDLEDRDQKALSDAITIVPTSSATTSSSPFGGSEDAMNAASPSPRRRDEPTVSTLSSTSSAPGTVSTSLPTTPSSSKWRDAQDLMDDPVEESIDDVNDDDSHR